MKKKVVLFPGQGAQYVGMGKKLCEEYKIARDTFEEASDILSRDMKKLCFNSDLGELTSTENAQPAILTVSVASYRVLKEISAIKPHYMAGHSLGELSALTCAGAIRYADALILVRERGRLMRSAAEESKGIMTAVGKIPRDMVQAVCDEMTAEGGQVCISNYNSPVQNVISGDKETVEKMEKLLGKMGASVRRLNVSAPFHSPFMKPAADEFQKVLEKYSYNPPQTDIVANTTADLYLGDDIIEKLTKQIYMPVRWMESMQFLRKKEVRLAVDIGPGKVVRDLFSANIPTVKALSFDISDDKPVLTEILKNDKKIPFVSRCMGLAVAAKNRCMDQASYNLGVIEPYKKLQSMQDEIERSGREATEEERKTAIGLLQTIFDTKAVPESEQEERFNRLYLDTETEAL